MLQNCYCLKYSPIKRLLANNLTFFFFGIHLYFNCRSLLQVKKKIEFVEKNDLNCQHINYLFVCSLIIIVPNIVFVGLDWIAIHSRKILSTKFKSGLFVSKYIQLLIISPKIHLSLMISIFLLSIYKFVHLCHIYLK